MSEKKKLFKVGSRESQLALIQTNYVIEQLQKLHPDVKFEITTMTTIGDQILDKPLPKIGEKSLFTKELEIALEKKEVDFLVHSLKDLPTILPLGLTIGAVLEREDPRDALIVRKDLPYRTIDSLPEKSVIGTSSLRRTAQLAKNYPHLIVNNIRGNLNTRLKKLDQDEIYSGIILATAGVKRMKWEERISQILEPDHLLYAVGQGALAVECRSGDDVVLEILQSLNHTETILKIVAERSFLKTLEGGCSAPVAACTTLINTKLSIKGAVWSLDGKENLLKERSVALGSEDSEPPKKKCPYREPKNHVGITARNVDRNDLDLAEKLGKDLAVELIQLGASKIIGDAKSIIINEKPALVKKIKEMSSSSSSSGGSSSSSSSNNNHSKNVEVR